MTILSRLSQQIQTYKALAVHDTNLVALLREAEVIEEVFHSNAIENSTISMSNTEKILLEMEIEGSFNIREIYEAKNLYSVYNYIEDRSPDITLDNILLIHQFLVSNINDSIAGRLRGANENVRVGKYLAPTGGHVHELISELLSKKVESIRDVARFHIDFERIHPFNDGNGRIGRVLINWQLKKMDLPPAIIRSETKFKDYYPHFVGVDYDGFELQLSLRLLESLHKRNAYLQGKSIVSVSEYARKKRLVLSNELDKAARMTIPAFREHGKWCIGVEGD